MFNVRYRSHHDAEHRLAEALGAEANSRRGGVSWNDVEDALSGDPPSGRRCIYIHVPYCDTICSFCNLNRHDGTGVDLESYTQYLLAEISYYAEFPYVNGRQFDAVYFGGGTPTILSGNQLARIIQALRSEVGLSDDCEITIESTLHNLPAKKVVVLEANGVNRLSLGVQTFSLAGRMLLNRTWGPDRAIERLAQIRGGFSGVFGIDIIYSYPGQTLAEVAGDASYCRTLPVDGVSFYSLMVHDESTLGRRIATGEQVFNRTIEQDLTRHNRFYRSMRAGGYELLELSKLVLPGRDEYRYIRIRYDNGDVLPIGAGAGGKLGGFRIYSMAPGRKMASPVDAAYATYHKALGHLQFGRYAPAEVAGTLGLDDDSVLREQMERFVAHGFLQPTNDHTYELTADGVFWGNNIAVEVLTSTINLELEVRHA